MLDSSLVLIKVCLVLFYTKTFNVSMNLTGQWIRLTFPLRWFFTGFNSSDLTLCLMTNSLFSDSSHHHNRYTVFKPVTYSLFSHTSTFRTEHAVLKLSAHNMILYVIVSPLTAHSHGPVQQKLHGDYFTRSCFTPHLLFVRIICMDYKGARLFLL